MVVINWLERFWKLIGKFINGMHHKFGSNTYPSGNGIYCEPTDFQPNKVWFNVSNPKNETSDWSKINLARVIQGNHCVNVVVEAKTDPCKVSWFMHN
jgi:hypothetical protein